MQFGQVVAMVLAALAIQWPVSAGADAREDAYAAGYAAAVIERDFGLVDPVVTVEAGVLRVRAAGLRSRDLDPMVDALSRLDGVESVVIADERGEIRATSLATRGVDDASPRVSVLPERDLFDPPLADPRWPRFSVIWSNYLDDDEVGQIGGASFGETFPIVRWSSDAEGGFELGIQGGVFSIFDLEAESFDLINSDFMGGIFGSYRSGDLSATLRLFHQSSHLGDEFLLRDRAERINLSYETVEALLSYDLGESLRLYAGGGRILHSDPSDLHPLSVQGGLELWSPQAFLEDLVRPIASLDVQAREETHWKPDYSVRAGVELASPALRRMRVQVLLEYYNGRSPNGQFFEREIDSLGLGAHLVF